MADSANGARRSVAGVCHMTVYDGPMSTPAPPAVDIVGVKEISDRLEAPRTTVSMWIARRHQSGFPSALAELAAGPVFDWNAVQAWHKARP